MGASLRVWGTTVTGTILSPFEFRDAYVLVTTLTRTYLQNKYYSCMQTFSVRHALSLSNGCLIIAHHNEIFDETIQLVEQDLSPH